jgi:hypothetical protein
LQPIYLGTELDDDRIHRADLAKQGDDLGQRPDVIGDACRHRGHGRPSGPDSN